VARPSSVNVTRVARRSAGHGSRVTNPDSTSLRLTFRGTHQGEFLGIPATGRTIEYISHEFYRIADGVFAEEWICSDMATLHGQLTAEGT
jgi:predicted ester cyclase